VVNLVIDHIIPQVAGGSDDFDNLCLACPTCNSAKHDFQTGTDPKTSESVPLFNPVKMYGQPILDGTVIKRILSVKRQ